MFVGVSAVSQFEGDEFSEAEVTDAWDKVEEDTLAVPLGVQGEVLIGSVLEVVHEGEAERVVGIALVAFEVMKEGIWHFAQDDAGLEGVVEGAAHA